MTITASPLVLFLGLGVFLSPAFQAYAQEPDVADAVELLLKGKARPALKAFQAHNREAGGECVACLLGVANAHSSTPGVRRRCLGGQEATRADTRARRRGSRGNRSSATRTSWPLPTSFSTPEYIPFVQRSLPHFRRA
ncbi:MAG: hypothetical protein VYE73_02225 [Acidobacteriota bacterium]|nr:hypothetical protein [Acidobacteriota bacterium]